MSAAREFDPDAAAKEASETGLRFASFAIHALAPERPGPKGGKRDQNRRAKVDALCEAALVLFLERGIDSTTIDEITQRAGTAKGSFYRYFNDKQGIVATIMAPIHHAVLSTLETCKSRLAAASSIAELEAAYQELALSLGATVFKTTDVVLLYLQEARGPSIGARAPVGEFADTILQKAIEMTHAAREHGLLRPFPAEVSARAVVGAVDHLLYAVLREEDVGEVLEIPGAITSMVLDGLRARPHKTE